MRLSCDPMRILTALVGWMCLATTLAAQAPTEKGRLGLALTEITKPWTGDLDGMVERRTVRVLTAYSRTLYFVDSGTPRGTAYSAQYNMDWMLMAAQGYQESRLDHNAKSQVGAIGVMQVMPVTGKELNVGDITQLEANIHAGVKFVRMMVDRYYAKEPMDDLNKVFFAFAAYNAGPGRVRQLRREAEARGLDPNVWFNNVERIASERIGRETVTYVSNIYKYYVTYLLIQGEYLQRQNIKKDRK